MGFYIAWWTGPQHPEFAATARLLLRFPNMRVASVGILVSFVYQFFHTIVALWHLAKCVARRLTELVCGYSAISMIPQEHLALHFKDDETDLRRVESFFFLCKKRQTRMTRCEMSQKNFWP